MRAQPRIRKPSSGKHRPPAPTLARPGTFEKFDVATLLAAVRARAAGQTVSAIAARLGVERIALNLCTNAVMDDDIAASGEPAAFVASFYWGRKA